MGFDLGIFKDPQLDADYIEWLPYRQVSISTRIFFTIMLS